MSKRTQTVFLTACMVTTATLFSLVGVGAAGLESHSGDTHFQPASLIAATGLAKPRPSSSPAPQREPPAFTIISISSSTSSIPGGLAPIEPAYGDSVTFHWSNPTDNPHVQAIVILTKNPVNGTIVDPNDSSEKYSIAATLPLDQSTNVSPPHLPNGALRTRGDLTWPVKGEYLPEFPAGRLRLGVQYADDHVRLLDRYINVYLSIYDAYTDNYALFHAGDKTEGKTSIYYTMSDSVRGGTVSIAMGNAKTIAGTTSKGKNVLRDAWDDTDLTGSYVPGGSYPMTFTLTSPKSDPKSLGPSLKVTVVTQNAALTPTVGGTLPIDFVVSEPVIRPLATQTYVDAAVYDSHGQFVRLLANHASVNIDNLSYLTIGQNELVWNGLDEWGSLVDAGTYTITLVAEDNAGVGCESPAVTTTVTVHPPPESSTLLQWPTELDDWDNQASAVKGVPGFTDSGSPVYFSVDGGSEKTATHYKNGTFFVDVPQTPGRHTVTLRTGNTRFPEKKIAVDYFINNPGISSPTDGARFDPQSGQPIGVTYNSQTADAVDVAVYDSFDQSEGFDSKNPVPVATTLNGSITSRLVRAVETGLTAIPFT